MAVEHAECLVARDRRQWEERACHAGVRCLLQDLGRDKSHLFGSRHAHDVEDPGQTDLSCPDQLEAGLG